jgi:hypothetical protein
MQKLMWIDILTCSIVNTTSVEGEWSMWSATFSILYTITPDDGLDLSRNMLWYTCLLKHAKPLLRTKDCCTYSLLHAQQDALTHNTFKVFCWKNWRKKRKAVIMIICPSPDLKPEPLLIWIFSTDTNFNLLQLMTSSADLGVRFLKEQCNANIRFPVKYFQPVSSLLTPKLPSRLRTELGKVNLLWGISRCFLTHFKYKHCVINHSGV